MSVCLPSLKVSAVYELTTIRRGGKRDREKEGQRGRGGVKESDGKKEREGRVRE